MHTPKISFLATGNELIEGDTLDTNGNFFARSLHDQGANIYQHVQASDTKSEIVAALHYLLEHSDAVITCGGMGPTSDDNTRFAVSEFTGKELIFDEASWKTIEERFQKFRLKAVPSNRQQALFPQGSTVYPNLLGSAPACYLEWKGKHIFMLPGPPRECRPIFETQVIPCLQQLNFFQKKETFRWLTLGLSESEIAEAIDELAKPHGFETGFRWSYPYLEIKIIAQDESPDLSVIERANTLLEPYSISRDRKNADESLEETLKAFGKFVYLVNEMTQGLEAKLLDNEHLIFSDKQNSGDKDYFFSLEAFPKISSAHPGVDTITFTAQGFVHQEPKYEHHITLPCRGPEVIQAAKAYAAWQLNQYLKSITRDRR